MVTTGGPYTGTVSYSFDEACLNPVAVSKKKPTVLLIVGIFFLLNGPMISHMKEMKWQKNSTSRFFYLCPVCSCLIS